MAEDADKTFEISYGLTDDEIKLLADATYRKQLKISSLGNYAGWIIIAMGVALAYLGGAIAHSYYAAPLNSNTSTLVMALFCVFVGGAHVQARLFRAWQKRIEAWRIIRHKETVSLKMNKDGISAYRLVVTWNIAWEGIDDVTFPPASIVFWHAKELGLLVPLRAIASAEERSAFIEAAKTWSKAR